jgi:16S rRNA (cytosine967-C5)-methyltransferase
MTPSRQIAHRVLFACDKTQKPFQALLDRQFQAHQGLDHRDRNLATQLVTGVLRFRLKIDWLLGRFSSIPLEKINPAVLAALRLGVYQLLFLDRIPESAAVNETVELVKSSQPPWVVGFVNALMRAVHRNSGAISYPDPVREPLLGLAVTHAHPLWLVERWVRRWGIEKTRDLLLYNNLPPPRTIRVNTLKTDRESLVLRLLSEGVAAEKTALSPEGLILIGGIEGPMYDLPSYQEGLWEAQDEGAQLISHLMPHNPGFRILDLCAGRGVKSGHLAQLAPDARSLTAVEIRPKKISHLKHVSTRLNAKPMQIINQDAVSFSLSWKGERFKAILADVPCTGTGILRRQPDVKWKNFQESLPRMVKIQRRLLEAAARLIEENGTITYATCSMEPEENEENITWFLEKRADFMRIDLSDAECDFIRVCADPEGYFRPWPSTHGTDGFFATVLKKKSE